MHQNIKNFINLIKIGRPPDGERKTLVCAYLCLRAASSASAAGAWGRGRVPSVFKGFSGVCSCALSCLSRVNKNKSPNHVSVSRDPLDLQEGKHKTKKTRVFCWEIFFIKVLDECHRLQVRCCEITETLLFYYHFLHLQVKLWRWCIGIITEPLCQRKWSFCLLCGACTGQTYTLTHTSHRKSCFSSLLH